MFALESQLIDCAHTHRVLDHFQPVRGIGWTEAECLQRACDAVLLQGLQQASWERRHNEFVFMYCQPDMLPLPSSRTPVWVFDQASQCYVLRTAGSAALKASGWQRVTREPSYMVQLDLSGYLTSAFSCGDLMVLPTNEKDLAVGPMQEVVEEVGGRLTSDWVRGQAEEIQGFLGTLHAFTSKTPPATPPLPNTSPTAPPLSPALADGTLGQHAVHARTPASVAVHTRTPAIRAGIPRVLVHGTPNASGSPQSSPTTKQGKGQGRVLDRPGAALDLSQVRDLSPESLKHTGDESEVLLPPCHNLSNTHAWFMPMPPAVSNLRKR
ncbi:hypothetical protein FRC06_001742 [Ceratobasidium sp. 370]|nr:hypothetical protein FRC06_001742 [Ceratobasidium sp. 370]